MRDVEGVRMHHLIVISGSQTCVSSPFRGHIFIYLSGTKDMLNIMSSFFLLLDLTNPEFSVAGFSRWHHVVHTLGPEQSWHKQVK